MTRRRIAAVLFGLASLCVLVVIVGVWAVARQAPPEVDHRTLVTVCVYFAAIPLTVAAILSAIGWYVRARATGPT